MTEEEKKIEDALNKILNLYSENEEMIALKKVALEEFMFYGYVRLETEKKFTALYEKLYTHQSQK